MGRMKLAFVLPVALCMPVLLAAQQPDLRTEKIEWTWADRPDAPDPKLPNVLLLGDSITRAYYPETQKQLAGVANVYLFATSACAADSRYPGQLKDYVALAAVPFAVVHFNNGMHGWRFTEAEYAASLPSVVDQLHTLEPHAKLLWANTTPVKADTPDGATNTRIDRRNAEAAATMKQRTIPVDDQHTLMLPHADLHADVVHWTPAGSAIQAAQVADAVKALLPKEAAIVHP